MKDAPFLAGNIITYPIFKMAATELEELLPPDSEKKDFPAVVYLYETFILATDQERNVCWCCGSTRVKRIHDDSWYCTRISESIGECSLYDLCQELHQPYDCVFPEECKNKE